MGFFDPDMESMLDIYQEETEELIEILEKHLIDIEKKSEVNEEEINEISRVVHTIKSSSAMMGLEDLSVSSHKLEDLFQLFREDVKKIKGQEQKVFDLTYLYIDYVKSELERILEEDYRPASGKELIHKIENFCLEEEKEIKEDNVAKKYSWKIHLTDNCEMKNVRAYMLMKQIEKYCSSITSIPIDLQNSNCIDQIIEDGLIFEFWTDEIEQVIKKLSISPYVKSLEDLDVKIQVQEVQEEVEEPEKKQQKSSAISWDRILRIQQITGELVTLQNQMVRVMEKLGHPKELESLTFQNGRALSELENVVNKASLLPISVMVQQYSRVIRDIARKEDKDISFKVSGEDLELDKTIIDAMTVPLIHLVRNAADHGIEGKEERKDKKKSEIGEIHFDVSNRGDYVYFSISDDGAGLNRERILKKAAQRGLLEKSSDEYTDREVWEFIFTPGFSTREQTTQYSGRGVGMDVVSKAVSQLGGNLWVDSKEGEGTKFTLQVPISLTSMDTIQFEAAGSIFLLPIKSILHIYVFKEVERKFFELDNHEYFQEESLIPVVWLNQIYGKETKKSGFVVVCQGTSGQLALVVDEIQGEMNIVEKPLSDIIGYHYKRRTGIIGCTITVDGKIGFVLSVERLRRMVGV